MNILNQLGANPSSIWHTAKIQKGDFAANAQWPPTIPGNEDNEECLAKTLAAAVEEYADKVLRGLGAMTEDEKAEKIAEFEAIHKPQNGTPQQMAEFAIKLREFKQALERLAEIEHRETLIKPAAAAEEENNNLAGFLRSQILANAPRTIK